MNSNSIVEKRFNYYKVISSKKYTGHHTSLIDVFKSKLPKNAKIVHCDVDRARMEYRVFWK